MQKWFWLAAGAGGALAAALLYVAAAQAEGPAAGGGVIVDAPGVGVNVGGEGVRVNVGEGVGVNVGPGGAVDVQVKLSDYWLGVECYPVTEAMRAQLGLAQGQGLAVEQVVPDGPAAAAGIKRHDVLLKAGGKPLGSIADLTAAVDAAKGKPLSLELIRAGKPMHIEVTPAKRPAETMPGPWAPPGSEAEAAKKWFEWFQQGAEGKPPMQFRFFHPGAILPPGAPVTPPLPANVSIAITRSGTEPAKIVVKRGDEKWEITENQLDKLPADLRPYVEQMLGRGPGAGRGMRFDFVPDSVPPAPALQPQPKPLEKRMEKMLEDMNRRIERLEKLFEQGPAEKKPEAK